MPVHLTYTQEARRATSRSRVGRLGAKAQRSPGTLQESVATSTWVRRDTPRTVASSSRCSDNGNNNKGLSRGGRVAGIFPTIVDPLTVTLTRVSPIQDASAGARSRFARAFAPRRVHRCDMTLVTIHPPRRHIAEKFTTFQTQATPRVRPPARARALSLSLSLFRPRERESEKEREREKTPALEARARERERGSESDRARINTTGVNRRASRSGM